MNISKLDLNLLVYLDVLLREKSVTRAAEQLSITQPAMSNGLRRLRDMLNDPLLVRTSSGMQPTDRALEIQPILRDLLGQAEKIVYADDEFNPKNSRRVFRIMASDYAESTLLPALLSRIRTAAPDVVLDVLTPSDVVFEDIEHGRVDMAINRFDSMPQSFHQSTVWVDSFSCLLSKDNPIHDRLDLEAYLDTKHVWVSKTGMGIGVGMNPDQVQHLGWVDEALTQLGKRRTIAVFTRHYQVAALLAQQKNLVVTLPTKAALLHKKDPNLLILKPPFAIPEISLTMAWGPLLHHNSAHSWLRRQVADIGRTFAP